MQRRRVNAPPRPYHVLVGDEEDERNRRRRGTMSWWACCCWMWLILLFVGGLTALIVILATTNGANGDLVTTSSTTPSTTITTSITTTPPSTTTTTSSTTPSTTTTTTSTTTTSTTTTSTTTTPPSTTPSTTTTTTAPPTLPPCVCDAPVLLSSFSFDDNMGRCLAFDTQNNLMYLFVGYTPGLQTMTQNNLTAPYAWGPNLLAGGQYAWGSGEVTACAYSPIGDNFFIDASDTVIYSVSTDGLNESYVLNPAPLYNTYHGFALEANGEVVWVIRQSSGLIYSFSLLNGTILSGPLQMKEYDGANVLQPVNGYDIRRHPISGLMYVLYNRNFYPSYLRTIGIVDLDTGIVTPPCYSGFNGDSFSTFEFTPDGKMWLATGQSGGTGIHPRTFWGADSAPCAYVPTTTTAAPTTSPSSFSLICPGSYMGELEETDLSNVPTGVVVVGTGCGGSNITVTGPSVGSTFVVAKNVLSRETVAPNTMEMAFDLITASESTPSPGPIVTYTPEEFAIQFGRNITNAAAASAKKDLYAYPAQKIYVSAIIGGIFQAQFYGPDEELYFSGDGDTYYVGVGTVQPGSIIFYTNNDAGSTLVDFNSIFPASCGGGYPLTPPSFTRYDWEAGRYVIVVMNNATGRLCVGVSNSSDPFQPWEIDTWDDARFTHSHGLGFAVWGDYYNLCWIDINNHQQCVIMERAKLLDNSAPAKIAFLDTPVFPVQSGYVVPPPYPMNQGYSVRGPMISTHAPCGMLSMLNDYTKSIDYMLCTGLDFSSPNPNGTIVFSVLHTNVTGGWISAHGNACDGNLGSNGCISIGAYKKPGFANYIRTAYHSFSGYERIAYTFVSELLVKAKVMWGEMTAAELLSETPTTPGSPVIGTGFAMVTLPTFASNLIYDCRETLHLVAYVSSGTSLQLFHTYKLRTDPGGALRTPAAPTPDGTLPVNNNWGMATLSQSAFIPRIYHGMWLFHTGWSAQNVGLKTENVSLVYTGEDACMHQEMCTQYASFGTIASCSNTVVGY